MGITYRNDDGTTREEFSGLVLGLREQNLYHDSYFYAQVYVPETGEVKSVEYGATAYYGGGRAIVDAPQTLRAEIATRESQDLFEIALEKETQGTIGKGAIVKSLTTRGKNVGVTGEVKWIGRDEYNRYANVTKVGIKVEGEPKLRYLTLDNVALVDPPEVSDDRQEELAFEALYMAARARNATELKLALDCAYADWERTQD